jgi:elongation factor Ts
MVMISAEAVKELRRRTNAPLMSCKKALVETDGDLDKAVEWLRLSGLRVAQRRSAYLASEGSVSSYIHGEGRIGVLLEVNSETDFVARTDAFKTLCKEIAMQIAASSPRYVRRDEVPAGEIEKEKEIYSVQLKQQGKPEKIIPKIMEGMVNKWYGEICLMEQTYNRDRYKTIEALVNELVSSTGEKIVVRRFVRFELGEGLGKRQNDLAAEVADLVHGEPIQPRH